MGRIAQGFRVFWRGERAFVRFTHQGTDHRLPLGTTDPREASERAASEYAKVVSGRRRPLTRRGAGRALLELPALLAEWVDSQRGVLDETTCDTLETYARHFISFFGSLDEMTEESCADYGRTRLRKVLRRTVLKELSFLRNFFGWCVDHNVLVSAPFVAIPKRTSTGVRSGRQRAKSVEVSADEARAIIERLPASSKTIGGRRWPLRARFLVAWETGLRPESLARLSVPGNFHAGSRKLVLDDADDKARYGRELPLSDAARAALEASLPPDGAGLLFGRHRFDKVLKASAIAVLGEQRGQDFAPYDFRHGFGTHLVDEGAPLTGVAYLMGHKRLSTTDRYVKGNLRAAERALAVVGSDVPAQLPPEASSKRLTADENLSKNGGDRRGSNPRHLEPQRNDIGPSVENHERSERLAAPVNLDARQLIRPLGRNPPRPLAWVHEATANLFELLAARAS